MWNIKEHPGLLYVIATLLPLASFALLLVLGGLRNAAGPYRRSGVGATLYWLFGGDRPVRLGAWVATGAIALSFLCSATGLVWFLKDHPPGHEHQEAHAAAGHDEGE